MCPELAEGGGTSWEEPPSDCARAARGRDRGPSAWLGLAPDEEVRWGGGRALSKWWRLERPGASAPEDLVELAAARTAGTAAAEAKVAG